jgi:hypothetical protein
VPVLAVVLSLATIIYLLSWGLHEQGTTPVILNPAPQTQPEKTGEAESNGPSRSAETAGSEVSDSISTDVDRGRSRQAGGRIFDLEADVWIERGLPVGGVVDRLTPGSREAGDLRRQLPELDELADLGRAVRLRVGDRVVEMVLEEIQE